MSADLGNGPVPARGLQARLRDYLVTGLFVTIPVGLSVILMVWVIGLVDNIASPLIQGWIGRPVPGLGLVLAVVVVLTAGFLASNVVGATLLSLMERLLLRIPVFNWLYRTIRQITDAFSPGSAASFHQVVVIEYPAPGLWSLGFVTKELSMESGDGGRREMAAVYIPTNHFYFGSYVMVPREAVHATQMSVQEGIQSSLSAGASIPDVLQRLPTPPKKHG